MHGLLSRFGFWPIAPPVLLVAALLARSSDASSGTNLALNKPVTVSSYEATSYPEYAVDGDHTLTHWWGANPYPQWLEVDLLSVGQLDQLHLWTYWDSGRHYRYTIEVSIDRVGWTEVVDMSSNTTPSTAAGFAHDVGGVQARFVRVNMLMNSANPGVHIVELEALGTQLPPGELEVVPGGPLDFGGQDINAGATATRRVVIRNTDANHFLSLHDVGLGGQDSDDFTIALDSGEVTLDPGGGRLLELAFDPSLPRSREATLTIGSDDTDEAERQVIVTGTGSGTLFPLIPQPAEIQEQASGDLPLTSASRIIARQPELVPHAEVLAGELYRITGIRLPVKRDAPHPGDVVLSCSAAFGEEEYGLGIADQVIVRARDAEGIARATATLLQLVGADGSVPAVRVHDEPAFPYRALSLDVARKHHSIDVLKQAVDLCRFYKVRYLGLHLTDDQSFMFPSTAFPNVDQNNYDQPAYSLAELVELEQYALARGVALVPELDVPGHSAKLVQLYPQVFGSLSGSTIDFRSPACVDGVKTLITEMLAVFSSTPCFHIGGDESGFAHLPEFPTFVKALDEHVKASGRTTVMWEGFAAGSPIPRDVLVIGWESSYYRPDALLQAGYTVINGGWDPLYVVDHYPWVQYTYHSPERLYGFDPFTFGHVAPGYPASNGITVPPDSDVPGAAMCWWEGRGDLALPILRNRVGAFGARLWNTDGELCFESFEARFEQADERLEALLFPVRIGAPETLHDFWKPERPFTDRATVSMATSLPGTIRYTLDGTEPTTRSPAYVSPLTLTDTTTVLAALFEASGERVGFVTRIGFQKVQRTWNLTTDKPVVADSPEFIEHPPALVVDGVVEGDAYWTCFPNPASLTVDLEAVTSLDGVTVFSRWGGGYYEQYRVELSVDGASWTEVVDFTSNSQPASAQGYAHTFSPTEARYLRLNTTGNSWFPAGRFPRIVEVRVQEAP